LNARNLGLGGRDVRRVGGVFVGAELRARQSRAIDGIAESLRKPIGRLTRSKEVESQTALVECALRDASRPVQFLS
jgi:hypothetical protein